MNRGKVQIDNSYILNSAPLSSTPLKVGILSKRGDQMKTWKKRHFIAYNEADNFVISYGTTDSPDTEISRFSCSGYNVELFSKDETEIYGEYGIKLVPLNNANRRWVLCAPNASDQEEWILIFSNACRKSEPVRDPDPLVRDAFAVAYQQTRQLYGFYGSSNMKTGTEIELMRSLVVAVLKREMIDDLIASVEQGTVGEMLQHAPVSSGDSSGRNQSRSYSASRAASGMSAFNPMRLLGGTVGTTSSSTTIRQQQINSINRMVESKVRPAVKLCWNHCREEVIGFSSEFIAYVTPLAPEVLACEEAIEEMLYAPVVAHIDPVHTELQFRLLMPVASVCGPNIIDAYEMALRSLFQHMSQRIGVIMCNPTTLDDEIENLLSQVDRNSVVGDSDTDSINANNLLMASKEILLNMSTVGLAESADDFVGTITPNEIYLRVMDDLQSLLHDAVYSFWFALKNQGVTNRIIIIFNEIILKLCTDMGTKMRVSFFQILQEVAEFAIQVNIL